MLEDRNKYSKGHPNGKLDYGYEQEECSLLQEQVVKLFAQGYFDLNLGFREQVRFMRKQVT